MLDVEWPDVIPEGFAREHGLDRLRDTVSPEIPADVRRDARQFAEETVAGVKKEIFPVHDIPG
jgi:hypothetical protein